MSGVAAPPRRTVVRGFAGAGCLRSACVGNNSWEESEPTITACRTSGRGRSGHRGANGNQGGDGSVPTSPIRQGRGPQARDRRWPTTTMGKGTTSGQISRPSSEGSVETVDRSWPDISRRDVSGETSFSRVRHRHANLRHVGHSLIKLYGSRAIRGPSTTMWVTSWGAGGTVAGSGLSWSRPTGRPSEGASRTR